MEISYQHKPTIPFSLHDMRVHKIELADKTLRFSFENGYVKLSEPVEQVAGDLRIEGVDLDFSYIHFLSPNGQFGGFRGTKLSIPDFIRTCPAFSFEIIDELYGYNAVHYGGFLSLPNRNKLVDMTLSVYHWGSIIYEVKDGGGG